MSGTLEPAYGPLPSDRQEHCHSLHDVELVLETEERRGEISHFKVGDIQPIEIRPRLALAAAQTRRRILMCAGSFCVLLLKKESFHPALVCGSLSQTTESSTSRKTTKHANAD